MTTPVAKLKEVYDKLASAYTHENKLEFDTVVWKTLPELWKYSTKIDAETKRVYDYLSTMKEPCTIVGVAAAAKTTTYRVTKAIDHLKLETGLINQQHADFRKYSPRGCGSVRLVYPRGYAVYTNPKNTKALPKPNNKVTPFISWFETNYEPSEGFTPVFDLVKQCQHTISEDRAKSQLKDKGYLIYHRKNGDCVQAKPVKKSNPEFVNLSEVLKELK